MARKREAQFESVMPVLLKGGYKTQVRDIIKFRKRRETSQYFSPIRIEDNGNNCKNTS